MAATAQALGHAIVDAMFAAFDVSQPTGEEPLG